MRPDSTIWESIFSAQLRLSALRMVYFPSAEAHALENMQLQYEFEPFAQQRIRIFSYTSNRYSLHCH